MKTRLFVRPVSDIQVYDTMWMGGNLGLVTDWDTFGIIQTGDVISLDMTNKFVNPSYSGQRTVLWMEPFEDKCVIILNYTFGSSTSNETGSIRNIVRGQAQFSDILVEGGGTTESFGAYTYQGLDTNGNPWYFYPGTLFSIKWYEPEDESFKGWVLYDNLDNPVYAAPSVGTAMSSPCSSVSWVVQEPYGEAPVPSFTCTSKYSVRFQAVELDLKQDSQFPLSYQIADIREPQNRKSDYSKQITLPGTKHNADVLEQLFEIGVDSAWNVNLKKDCFVLQEGQEVLAGSIRIDSIQRDQWNNVEYKVSILGRLGDFFQALTLPNGADMRLNDLNFNEWLHTLNYINVQNSWNGLIQRSGAPFNSFTYSAGVTFTSISINPSDRISLIVTSHSFQVGDTVRVICSGSNTPYLNGDHTVVQTTPTSITINFSQYSDISLGQTGTVRSYTVSGEGYTYPTYYNGVPATGSTAGAIAIKQPVNPSLYLKTLVDSIFKRIGWSYSSDFFDSQYFKRLLWVNHNGLASALLSVKGSSTIQCVQGTSTSAVMPIISANWQNSWDPITNTYTNTSGASITLQFSTYMIGNIENNTPSVGDISLVVYSSLDGSGNPDPNWATGTGYLQAQSPVYLSGNTLMNGMAHANGWGPAFYRSPPWLFNVTLQANEQFRLNCNHTSVPNPNAKWEVRYSELSSALYTAQPGDTTFRDFMTDLIKMFNLMVEPDRYKMNHLKIEPFSEYYKNDIIDWTYNVDISKPVDIVPVSPLLPKNYKFTYSEDSDYLNKSYKDTFADIYGSHEKTTYTEWSKNTETIQLKIAPSPYLVVGNVSMPAIAANSGGSTGTWTELDKAKPRIWYWGGLRRTNIELSVAGVQGFNNIGQAGPLDQPLDSTVDLNFGQANAYGILEPFRLTSNNLYNKFYSQYIEELSDNSSLKVTFSMKLNANDIRDLRFDAIYLIKDTYYRLQKVIDWDPMTGAPCKVEMLKIRQYPAHEPSSDTPNNPGDYLPPELEP